MNSTLLVFGVTGIGLVAYGSYVLKNVPEQLKSGKTKLTGKAFSGATEVDKSQHATTFWATTSWNAIRSVLAILFGLTLIAVAVMDLLKP